MFASPAAAALAPVAAATPTAVAAAVRLALAAASVRLALAAASVRLAVASEPAAIFATLFGHLHLRWRQLLPLRRG